MDWNEKGEIIIDGHTIEGSHIIELMKDCLSKFIKGNPLGYEEFYCNLCDIPLSLISNVKRHPLIGRGGGKDGKNQSEKTNKSNSKYIVSRSKKHSFSDIGNKIPPPGVPVHKRFRYLDRDTSWIEKWNSKLTKI